MEIDMAKCKSRDGEFPPLKWNGMRRASEPWSFTQQDQEIWSEKGNCLVYLHSKSDGPRSPSFKLHFSDLLTAKCQPLINQYIDFADQGQSNSTEAPEKWSIELYIPPPTRRDAARHSLSIRNLFAWVLRRSLVGDHLGPALVQLLGSMRTYRSPGEDNVGDLMSYLEEEGYLDFAGQPSFALGILSFAEQMQLHDLYIRAFAHCVGMTDSISANAEYMKVSLRTRNLIRRARDEMYNRITRASRTLQKFLEAELSSAFLGLQPGPRAHLNKFRQFLMSHYHQEISIVPGSMLECSTLEAMREDFEALYDLLVDDHCEFTGTVSGSAGGICTLQAVQAFEAYNQFEPLAHSLPLLPELDRPATARRVPWASRAEKYKAPRDLISHTALIAASNWRPDIAKNPLVQAYRLFEQDSILTHQTSKAERISLVDARKVRWILVYTTYQVLRSVTKRPPQLDADGTPYHLSVCVDNLPPWDKTSSIFPDSTAFWVTPTWDSESSIPPKSSSSRIDIKPDIDYYAITHKEHPPVAMHHRSSIASATARTTQALARSTSVTRALTRSYTFRKSIRRSKTATPADTPLEAAPAVPRPISQKQAFHEIVVHGYGNGTNDVNLETPSTQLTQRTDSTASQSNSSSASARNSNASTEDMWDLAFKASPPASPMTEASEDTAWCEPDAVEDILSQPITRNSSRRSLTRLHPIKTALSGLNHHPSVKRASTFERRNSFKESFSGIARSHSLRRLSLRHDSLNSPTSALQARECDIDEQDEEQPWGSSPTEAEEWDAMEAFLDGNASPEKAAEGAWEQYNDLGGLTAIA